MQSILINHDIRLQIKIGLTQPVSTVEETCEVNSTTRSRLVRSFDADAAADQPIRTLLCIGLIRDCGTRSVLQHRSIIVMLRADAAYDIPVRCGCRQHVNWRPTSQTVDCISPHSPKFFLYYSHCKLLLYQDYWDDSIEMLTRAPCIVYCILCRLFKQDFSGYTCQARCYKVTVGLFSLLIYIYIYIYI